MKSIFKTIIFFFVGITFLVGCKTNKVLTKTTDQPNNAVNTKNEASLLWKVEGNGIKPSYVFGTIHMLKHEDFNLKESVKTAFNAVEQLVLEIDMDDPAMQVEMMNHVGMKDGMTIKQLLKEETYKALDTKLQETMGVGIQIFDTWQPIIVSTLLLKDVVGEQPASFEQSFMHMAQKNEIEIIGLEKVEEQLNFFHAIPYKDQAKAIEEYINETDEMVDGFNKMTAIYLSEDIDALLKFTEAESKGYINTADIVDKRNENWIPKIKEMASEKSSFFGVGAGHLGGPKGVINLLRKAGYTVTPIK